MKALVYSGPELMALAEQPEPEPAAGEALIRIEAVGICGSDMHAYLGHDSRRPAPLVLGHEASGVALTGRFKGRRVVVNPLVTCGACDACQGGRANLCAERQIISMPPRPGAFAERLAMPERNLIPLPEGMNPGQAALTEPVATALHGVTLGEQHLWRPLAEARRILVLGGGAVGLSAALILLSRGGREVWLADTNPLRRATAEKAAADLRVFDPLAEAAPESGFALVVDAVGGKATRMAASAAVSPGGVIVHIGLADSDAGLDIRKVTLQEIAVVGSYTYSMVDFRAALAVLAEGRLGALDWIEERPLAEGPQAFRDLLQGRTPAAKIVLRP